MKYNGRLVFCSLIGILICVNAGFAQVKRHTYYFKDSGDTVKSLDSANYIRIESEPDSGSTLYDIKEYYKNNVLKLTGKSSRKRYLDLQGLCITYFPFGVKQQVSTYKDGKLDGDAFDYFPNGRLYTQKQFKSTCTYDSYDKQDFIIQVCNDSTGKATVVNGMGHYIGYTPDFEHIAEEGGVKNGLRDGDWTGGTYGDKFSTAFPDKLNMTFNEKYSNGILISGQAIDQDGAKYSYTKRYISPEFNGGQDAFNQFLGGNIKYPRDARKNGIQGRVYISFVVDTNGSLTNFKIFRSPTQEFSDECLRVLKISPKWNPCYRYGKAVRVQYTVPINFALN